MENTLDRILGLMSSRNISSHKLEADTGLANGAIYKLKIGKNKPTIDTLIKIADYFNVSLDYLVGRSVSEDETLSEERQALLKEARSIPEGQVPLLLAVIKQFNNR